MIAPMGIYATGDSGLAKVLMPVPDPHEEVFERQWQLRAGDVDRLGRLRLDGVVRYMQDMGQDHLREKGYDILKFFPAEQAGGVPFLKALASPFAGIRFCPTGSVSAKP